MITSAREPAVRIALPVAVNYWGAERFVLYGIADGELHGGWRRTREDGVTVNGRRRR